MERLLYLDHAATTPADPEVVGAMLPWHSEQFGNPSTVYGLGLMAAEALERAENPSQRVSARGRRRSTSRAGAPNQTTGRSWALLMP